MDLHSILHLSSPARYEFAVKTIAKTRLLWSLKGAGGWALAGSANREELMPIWPDESFAHVCRSGEWEGHSPESISLDVFLERWVPGLQRDARFIAVFPRPDNKGAEVSPARFAADILREVESAQVGIRG